MQVTDTASHRRDQIANFAEILCNAKARQKVFEAVYFGKKEVKTIEEIAKVTGYSAKRVATIARPLARGEKLFEQSRKMIAGRMHTVYKKIDFVVTNKKKILSLARGHQKLAKYNTKTNPITTSSRVRVIRIRIPFQIHVRDIRVDDIDEFSKIKRLPQKVSQLKPARLSETAMKRGIIRLLGEPHVPKDWGGENNDIFTTKLTLSGKKQRAAFALKGPAVKGPLVPKKMGANGDQIQRLFDSPARVFLLQYEGEVKESVYKQMEELAKAKATSAGRVYWGVIDGDATKLLRIAYPKEFQNS